MKFLLGGLLLSISLFGTTTSSFVISDDSKNTQKALRETELIASFIYAWAILPQNVGNLDQINFEKLFTDEYIYPNATIINTSYDSTVKLHGSDIVWKVIPIVNASSYNTKIIVDFSADKELMAKPIFYEKYFAEAICSETLQGELNYLASMSDDIFNIDNNGTEDDGIVACEYRYDYAHLDDTNDTNGTIPDDDEYRIYAWGDIDYTDSLDTNSTCQHIVDGAYIVTNNASQEFTFYTSQDTTCSGKNKTYDYKKISNTDVNEDFEIYVEYKKSNTAPDLRDKIKE